MARDMFQKFDAWASNRTALTNVEPGDFIAASIYIRRLDVTLQAPDAMHIAVAYRIGATLVTFDIKMAASASTLGVTIAKA